MSDSTYSGGLRLVAPALVQTESGEVEGRAGDYLVITTTGTQLVMSEAEYLQGSGAESLKVPVDCNSPEIPDSSVPPDQPGGRFRSLLGRLRRERVPVRTVVSVTEEGFRTIEPNHSEIPNSSDPEEVGIFDRFFGGQTRETVRLLEGTPETYVPVPGGIEPASKWEVDPETPVPAVSLDAGVPEPEGMSDSPTLDICHNLPEPEEPSPYGIPMNDQANRKLVKLEQVAMANIGTVLKRRNGPLGFLVPGKKAAAPKKRKVMLPFQKKKAAIAAESLKEKYEWVPIEWF